MKRLASVLLRILCVWTWADAYRRYIDKITTSGYIGKPSPIWRFFSRCLFRTAGFFWVGKVRIVGEENLLTPGRLIFTPNHSSLLDAVVMFPTMARRPVRAMGAYETLRTFGGLSGIFLTKIGVFPVDRTRGKTVLGPATDLLVGGESLAMFPEGKISPTGEPLPYKLGAAIIGTCAWERLDRKERVGFVPVQICYHKRHNATALNVWKMGFRWRGGCTVTFGKPIWIDELPDRDPKVIMALIKDAIQAPPCPTMPR